MKFYKKSLGQNFLIDKNIVKKISNITNLKNKDVIEIGPGKGSLTDEILKKKPKSLLLIEKDNKLSKFLFEKYHQNKSIKIKNFDILKFNFNELKKRKYIVIGNLPYNISSKILINFLKLKDINLKFSDFIFMFQKELAEKIISKYPSKNYGRLSIITSLKLSVSSKFLVSANSFFPKPKVTSMVIHLKTFQNPRFNIKKISNLEKITNLMFSQKRKMINKTIKKILNDKKLGKIKELNLNFRPAQLNPEIYYKITELFEEG